MQNCSLCLFVFLPAAVNMVRMRHLSLFQIEEKRFEIDIFLVDVYKQLNIYFAINMIFCVNLIGKKDK